MKKLEGLGIELEYRGAFYCILAYYTVTTCLCTLVLPDNI